MKSEKTNKQISSVQRMYQPIIIIIIITNVHPSIMLLVKLQTKMIERQVSINRKVKRGEENEEKCENQIYKG